MHADVMKPYANVGKLYDKSCSLFCFEKKNNFYKFKKSKLTLLKRFWLSNFFILSTKVSTTFFSLFISKRFLSKIMVFSRLKLINLPVFTEFLKTFFKNEN